MNRFMRLLELAREEVAEGLTIVRSRIPRSPFELGRPSFDAPAVNVRREETIERVTGDLWAGFLRFH
jgi:hypothetical protein